MLTVMNLVLPIVVLLIAVIISLVYLAKPVSESKTKAFSIGGYRPWRRVGAAICLLIAVMYIVGISRLNAEASPRTFILYWITILLLVLWLCALALKDLLYTRATIARWRAGEADLDGTPIDRSRESEE